jgi:hypothetical protein
MGGLAGIGVCELEEELELGAAVSGGIASVWAARAMGARMKARVMSVSFMRIE